MPDPDLVMVLLLDLSLVDDLRQDLTQLETAEHHASWNVVLLLIGLDLVVMVLLLDALLLDGFVLGE